MTPGPGPRPDPRPGQRPDRPSGPWAEALRGLALHVAAGFGIATVFVLALLWTDPGGLAGLLLRAAGHPWPLALLWFFTGLTFGAVQVGIAVMQKGPPA